jgi:hypothetical protein
VLLILDLSGNELERVDDEPAPGPVRLLEVLMDPRPALQVVINDVDVRRDGAFSGDDDVGPDEGSAVDRRH